MPRKDPTRPYEIPGFRICLVREPGVALAEKPELRTPAAAARIVAKYIGDADREQFVVSLLTVRHRLLGALGREHLVPRRGQQFAQAAHIAAAAPTSAARARSSRDTPTSTRVSGRPNIPATRSASASSPGPGSWASQTSRR